MCEKYGSKKYNSNYVNLKSKHIYNQIQYDATKNIFRTYDMSFSLGNTCGHDEAN